MASNRKRRWTTLSGEPASNRHATRTALSLLESHLPGNPITKINGPRGCYFRLVLSDERATVSAHLIHLFSSTPLSYVIIIHKIIHKMMFPPTMLLLLFPLTSFIFLKFFFCHFQFPYIIYSTFSIFFLIVSTVLFFQCPFLASLPYFFQSASSCLPCPSLILLFPN